MHHPTLKYSVIQPVVSTYLYMFAAQSYLIKNSSVLSPVSLPLIVVRLHFLLAVPIRVNLAIDKMDNEVVIFEHSFLTTPARDIDAVGVQQPLWDQCQFGENGRMPLHDVLLRYPLASCIDLILSSSIQPLTNAWPSAF